MTIAALVEPTILVARLRAVDPGRDLGPVARSCSARIDDPASVVVPGRACWPSSRWRSWCVAETGRLPVDNPSTHLELTMVHEAMVLEYSGRDLAWSSSAPGCG